MRRRVVVTGMGAISPVGNDVPTMWKNMIDGVCGIETITAFDTSDLKVHIAGTIKNFDPTQYVEKKEVRKLDPYTQYAIAAAQQAVDDSGILGKVYFPRLVMPISTVLSKLIDFAIQFSFMIIFSKKTF